MDDLSRQRLLSGNLKTLITTQHIVGVTTNPSIFQAALTDGASYQQQIGELAARGADVDDTVRVVTTDDVRDATDLFSGVYSRTGGVDGRVSIEVDPRLAHDTEGTIAQAQELFKIVDRANVLIKIPATLAGLPAITAVIAEGISVNVTLIFSLDRYRAVMDAYLAGLEQATANGHQLSDIHSVASFFVSRVDLEIDKRLKAIGTPDAEALLGAAAIANARLAYQAYEQTFAGARWDALAAAGANKQRPLWASTGVKDPAYDDTRYVVELVAPGTVNTAPEKTINAVADHGVIRGNTIAGTYGEAAAVFSDLAALGIDVDDVFAVLEAEGVEKVRTGLDRTAGQCCRRTPERPPGTVTTGDDAPGSWARRVARPVTVNWQVGALKGDRGMVTMRDVAEKAGVSTATVSHVLNNTRKVNPGTVAAVREAVARTGYVNDGVARAMRTGATRTIGLAMSAISNPYFGDVVHSIEELLTQQDYSLLLADTHDNPDSEKRAIGDLLRQRPTGIILAPSAYPGDVLTAVAARKIPLVCIDRVIPGIDSVGVENETAVQKLVAHLIDLGHQRISMVAGRQGLTTTEERVKGYTTQMAAARTAHHRRLGAPRGLPRIRRPAGRPGRVGRPGPTDGPGCREQPDDDRCHAGAAGCRAVRSRRSRARRVRRFRMERPVQPPTHRSCATRKRNGLHRGLTAVGPNGRTRIRNPANSPHPDH